LPRGESLDAAPRGDASPRHARDRDVRGRRVEAPRALVRQARARPEERAPGGLLPVGGGLSAAIGIAAREAARGAEPGLPERPALLGAAPGAGRGRLPGAGRQLLRLGP